MSDKIGKYYWVKTKAGKEIAFKRDSGLWEMHGIDCIEDCNELILEVYGEVASGDDTSDSGLHLQRVRLACFKEVQETYSKCSNRIEFEEWLLMKSMKPNSDT